MNSLPNPSGVPEKPPWKLKMTVAYEGTQYSGWQTQKTGIGVQQKLEEALGQLFPRPKVVHSSSRTDTGVHALGMVVHVEIPRHELKMPPRKLLLALNAHLPEDIRVMAVSRCREDFHARFSAVGKEYRYLVWNHPAMNPLWRHCAWHVPQKLDFQRMKIAARHFEGTHDFRALAANRNYPFTNTVRTLACCRLQRRGPMITIILRGSGFLYKMCRGIVGTLVQVGQNKISPGDIVRILDSRDRRLAGMSAPAHGLVLWKVCYGPTRPTPAARSHSAIASEP
ncbi:MAG TPA: tRNA pseudouridine(38-40) synthase TruA [Candidatus Paceibacterota bacterium]|nr:tRNA pseudouridine(38-40) synthase TruA [Verrucomicrobiota bacterium]HRY48921.1 tRNA pseudouridine(38-40) synthase TruA [Candidatus Paceibacterota bacterium]HRZ99133.1 tRNA pseudouridine(38-40) synthase TruA [Candidatus Paceibacterota bacterium]